MMVALAPSPAPPAATLANGRAWRARLLARQGDGSAQAFDDGGVGHAAAFAHRLEAVATAGALELVEQGGHELGARAPERVSESDGTAVDVDLAHVRMVLLLPREHDR